jgi:hypothetical protein
MRRSVLAVGFVSLVATTACDKTNTEAGPVASAAPSASGPVASGATSSAVAPTASATTATVPDTIIAQHVLVIYKGAKRAPRTIARSKAAAKARAAEALAKIQGGAAFEDIVKQYSDDEGSVDRLGSLGKFSRDRMDPAFSAAAFALQPGQVSDVVETPFGFHVIKRTQ